MTKILEIRDLVKEFPGVKALQGLIKCVSSALEPTSGKILFRMPK